MGGVLLELTSRSGWQFEARLPLGGDSPSINGNDESSEGFYPLITRRSGRIGGECGRNGFRCAPPGLDKITE